MLMVYVIIIQIVNALFSAGTFYYCNWVLGSYNDGYTQALFYALGQAPLGIGILLCTPVCRKFGTFCCGCVDLPDRFKKFGTGSGRAVNPHNRPDTVWFYDVKPFRGCVG